MRRSQQPLMIGSVLCYVLYPLFRYLVSQPAGKPEVSVIEKRRHELSSFDLVESCPRLTSLPFAKVKKNFPRLLTKGFAVPLGLWRLIQTFMSPFCGTLLEFHSSFKQKTCGELSSQTLGMSSQKLASLRLFQLTSRRQHARWFRLLNSVTIVLNNNYTYYLYSYFIQSFYFRSS